MNAEHSLSDALEGRVGCGAAVDVNDDGAAGKF